MRPDFELFFSMPLHIQVHAICAIGALGLGLVQFLAPKGTIPHRALGYVWVVLMGLTAITAIFILLLAILCFAPLGIISATVVVIVAAVGAATTSCVISTGFGTTTSCFTTGGG